MYLSYKPKQKSRTNPYLKKPEDSYQTIYIEKYNSIILIQYDNKNNKDGLESLIENQLEENQEESNDNKIISLENRVQKIKDKKYIFPDDYRNPKKERENIIYYPEFLKNKEKLDAKESLNRDPKSGASVVYVPQSSLPSGPGYRVLGMYVPATHTIYISKDLPEHQKRFVYHHEVAHALGIRNEAMADNYAASIVGYNLRRAA